MSVKPVFVPPPDAATSGAQGLADRLRDAAKNGDTDGLKKAAQKFEQYFVATMMKEMRKASGNESGLFSGTEMETFHALFDEEIAGRITEGQGVGLARMIERNLAAAYSGEGTAGAVGSAAGAAGRTDGAALSASLREGFAWPLPASEPGSISSDYGRRVDPHSGAHKHHAGLDIAAPAGTPVRSIADGTVIRAGSSTSYGNVVDVQHADGTVSRYAHQQSLDVSVGDEVTAGDRLGAVGSTGRSTGPHLHLEVLVDGEKVDPHAFLRRD